MSLQAALGAQESFLRQVASSGQTQQLPGSRGTPGRITPQEASQALSILGTPAPATPGQQAGNVLGTFTGQQQEIREPLQQLLGGLPLTPQQQASQVFQAAQEFAPQFAQLNFDLLRDFAPQSLQQQLGLQHQILHQFTTV